MFKKKAFPFIILFTGIVVSCSAAYYSITGLSKLFAGAAREVIIMAASLEFAKLVLATSLKIYWNNLDKTFKYYSLVAVSILVIITSIGIYGFLSSAYQITSTKNSISNNEIAILDSKKNRFTEMKAELLSEKNTLNSDMTLLREGMNNSKDQTIDRKSGQILTKTNNNIKLYQSELEASGARKNNISLKIESLNDSISKIDNEILIKKQNNTTEAELGPLIFLKNLLGYSMDSIVNVLILMLMTVFDPLAISMLIIAISLFENKKTAIIAVENLKDSDILNQPTSNTDIGESHTLMDIPEDIILGTHSEDSNSTSLQFTDHDILYDNNPESSTNDIDVETEPSNLDSLSDIEKLDKMQNDNIINAKTFFDEVRNNSESNKKSDELNANEERDFYLGKKNIGELSTNQKKNMSQWQIKNHFKS